MFYRTQSLSCLENQRVQDKQPNIGIKESRPEKRAEENEKARMRNRKNIWKKEEPFGINSKAVFFSVSIFKCI